jgi:hypothetical protein
MRTCNLRYALVALQMPLRGVKKAGERELCEDCF